MNTHYENHTEKKDIDNSNSSFSSGDLSENKKSIKTNISNGYLSKLKNQAIKNINFLKQSKNSY